MFRSRQSDAANFMDIGRISAAIKRKVIELVEKGPSRTPMWGCVAEQGQRSEGAGGEKKSGEKNVTAAAFIALVVYFSTFVSRSLSDCQSASLPASPSALS